MKIAIKGHASRGKEVIQILESLGGNNYNCLNANAPRLYYYNGNFNHIDYIHRELINRNTYKLYTLEEFEKEFPFKIGDKVIIVGFPNFPKIITKMVWDCDEILYSFEDLNNTWFSAKALKKFEMKEERNITLTLEKAKEWYKKDGELREIALQAFSEKELNPLPKSWEEFCKQGNLIASWRYNIPTKYEALFKLEHLRDCWRQGWEPDWSNGKQAKCYICYYQGKFKISTLYDTRCFLSFPTREMAKEFLECFKDLIEKAGDLI